MVNNPNLRIVPEDQCVIVPTPDASGNLRNKITNGPVYKLQEAKSEAITRKIRYVTEKAANDQFDLGLGPSKINPFIQALKPSHRKGSERCLTSVSLTPPTPWEVDCDAYAMCWNNYYQQEFGDADEYYLKFGFKEDKESEFLVISIHE